MTGRMVAILLAACSCLANEGCTYRAWFEGFQERQRQECYKNLGQDEVQKCLDRVNRMTYDEYMRGREDSARQTQ